MSKALKQLLAGAYADQVKGSVSARKPGVMPKGRAVYLVSSAQNNTAIHEGVWQNIKAYARYRGAEILVARFTYNKSVYEAMGGRRGKDDAKADASGLWYAPEIAPHRCDENVMLTRTLMFAGELNIIPTASDPLSGFDNFGNRASLIVPHVRQEMRSIAGTHNTKLLYSTGTVTVRNYLKRKAGQLAEHYLAYGALVVEVDADGAWFVRQIRCLEDGSFQDLDVRVSKGNVYPGCSVEVVTPGDIHVDVIDPVVRRLIFGAQGVIDSLKPAELHCHDTLDFRSRNHHDRGNPYIAFEQHLKRTGDVEAEVARVSRFLATDAHRPNMRTIVIDSNHDRALARWLKEADYKGDPENARYFLRAQSMVYENIALKAAGRKVDGVLPRLLRETNSLSHCTFLSVDDSHVVCMKAGGVECALHGDLGPNGSRGSLNAFAKMGRRVNVGHSHSAAIKGDVFMAGTTTKLRLSYTAGPSSWSHSFIVTYPNGNRTMVTIWKGRWRGQENAS